MRILITGIAGFLGSHLAFYLKKHSSKFPIVGIDNLSRKGSETNVDRLKKAGIKFHFGDLRTPADVNKLPACDRVLDCAANPSVLAGTKDLSSWKETIDHNLIGTIHLLQYCARHRAGLILMSSSRVYSIRGLNDLPLFETKKRFFLNLHAKKAPLGYSMRGIRESFSTEGPISLYGATKLASEILAVECAAHYDFPLYINRSGVIAGPGQFGKIDQGILSYWIYSYLFGRPLSYIGYGGKGLQVRDFIHPDDIGSLIMKQLARAYSAKRPRIINIGGGLKRSSSLLELSDWCNHRMGFRKQIKNSGRGRLYDIPYYITDFSLARSEWNWEPQVSMEQILDSVWGYAEKNKERILAFF